MGMLNWLKNRFAAPVPSDAITIKAIFERGFAGGPMTDDRWIKVHAKALNWRDEEGAHRTDMIVVRKDVLDSERHQRPSMPAFHVYECTGRWGELDRPLFDPTRDQTPPRALFLVEEPKPASDPDLDPIAQRLQAPVEIDHPLLGALKLNRELAAFYSELELPGLPFPVRISISAEGDAPEAEALRIAEDRWSNLDETVEACKQCAVEHLLDLKNDTWREPDIEDEVTPEQFKARMKLGYAHFNANGGYGLDFFDGNLFLDHLICVDANDKTGPSYASIQG